jgi:uncharacterized phage protein gp47/JayE
LRNDQIDGDADSPSPLAPLIHGHTVGSSSRRSVAAANQGLVETLWCRLRRLFIRTTPEASPVRLSEASEITRRSYRNAKGARVINEVDV